MPIPKCDTKTHFDCGGGQCIPDNLVCNGKQDCPNWEDEPKDKCGINECNKNNGECMHKCIDTPASYYCDCDNGYKLVDNRTCKGTNKYISLHFIRCMSYFIKVVIFNCCLIWVCFLRYR